MELTVRRVHDCANLDCVNKAHQGAFVIVRTNESVVGGHRPLTLVMCAPCAEGLLKIATPTKTSTPPF